MPAGNTTNTAKYFSDGSGRDLYIRHNNGGLDFSSTGNYHNATSHKQWLTSTAKFLSTGYGCPNILPAKNPIQGGAWSTTSHSDYSWPSKTKNGRRKKGTSTSPHPNFSVPRNKEFVYPSGILFQYASDIATPKRSRSRTSNGTKLPSLTPKASKTASKIATRKATSLTPMHKSTGLQHPSF